MLKRLVIAASVTAVAFIGPVSGASADSSSQEVSVKAVKPKINKSDRGTRIIDWDAPAPSSDDDGGFSTQRIDWD